MTELSPNSQYRVDFKSGDRALALLISLPPNFPTDRPTIRVQPAVHHPWVDQNGVVRGAPGLVNFSYVHSDLGRVVQAIKREFELNQPVVLQQQLQRTHSGSAVHQQVASSNSASSITELRDLDVADLKELSENDIALKSLCESLLDPSARQKMDADIAALRSQIDSLSVANQSLQDRIEAKRESLCEKSSTLHGLKANARASFHEVKRLNETAASVAVLCDKLHEASLSKEEESEKLADEFLEGSGRDLDGFLVSYMQLRKQGHLRKIKEDKLRRKLPRQPPRF